MAVIPVAMHEFVAEIDAMAFRQQALQMQAQRLSKC